MKSVASGPPSATSPTTFAKSARTRAACRTNVPVSVCGEVAGDPRYTGLLLGMGIAELSMAPSNLLLVKEQVRSIEADAADALVRAVLRQSDGAEIRRLVAEFNDRCRD